MMDKSSIQVNLLQQVIEQGHKLRNSMLQTILKNDPFYGANQPFKTILNDETFNGLSVEDKHKFLAYLKGDPMSLNEERDALNTFRAMSTNDLCDITARSYVDTQKYCSCDICKSYLKINNSVHVPPLNLKFQESKTEIQINEDALHCLKYSDCLKIIIVHAKLNENGQVKVAVGSNQKYPLDLNTKYFVDYALPHSLQLKLKGGSSKVDSGLGFNNSIRHCSKLKENEVIYFKGKAVHKISSLENKSLDCINIKFKLSCRTVNQRVNNLLGFATFNCGKLLNCDLSCNQALNIYLDDSPVIVGTLKVNLQLGCKNLYFGKRFIEAINSKSEEFSPENDTNEILSDEFDLDVTKSAKSANSYNEILCKAKPKTKKKPLLEPKAKAAKTVQVDLNTTHVIEESKKVLFGFIYLANVEYLESLGGTYFTLQPFCQNDFIYSNVLNGPSNHFDYCQVIPFIYNEEFLLRLRDNYMVLEFFLKGHYRDDLIGICKVSLHQYYIAFRNPTIVKYLERNDLPVIGTDWFEPITKPQTGEITGQVQILVALGTEQQIHNLQKERGFKDHVVRRAQQVILKATPKTKKATKIVQTSPEISIAQRETAASTSHLVTPRTKKTTKIVQTSPDSQSEPAESTSHLVFTETKNDGITKKDKGVQKIEFIDKASQSEEQPTRKMANKSVETFQNYLQQLVVQNDAQESHNVQPRRTEDLLDTLQNALNFNTQPQKPAKDSFKARVIVESALHLPSRKKCKAKRVNGKLIREEILPSTYVTFESNDNSLKVSQVVQKTTSPLWDLRNDVFLPLDYLTNKEKKLVFKVWLKSNNGSTVPNMDIDSVLGFAAVDLTVLLSGLPTVDGWYNLIDVAGKCKGQIKVSITPLENISKYKKYRRMESGPVASETTAVNTDEPAESLSRALKRKFIELDEITQRLRSRLSQVTTVTEEEEDATTDAIADEFEKDINTLCIEEDYDLCNFAGEDAPKSGDSNRYEVAAATAAAATTSKPETSALQFASAEHTDDSSGLKPFVPIVSDNSSLMNFSSDCSISSGRDVDLSSQHSSNLALVDEQLHRGKEKIDTLLEKLSLIRDEPIEPFVSRYVSGCSVSADQNMQEIFSELGIDARADRIFDSVVSNINNDLQALCTEPPIRVDPDGENIMGNN